MNCFIKDDADGMEPPALTCEILGFGDATAAAVTHQATIERVASCLVPESWSVVPGATARSTSFRALTPGMPAIALETTMQDSASSFVTTVVVQMVGE